CWPPGPENTTSNSTSLKGSRYDLPDEKDHSATQFWRACLFCAPAVRDKSGSARARFRLKVRRFIAGLLDSVPDKQRICYQNRAAVQELVENSMTARSRARLRKLIRLCK